MKTVIIIGGGASGVLAAVQILSHSPDARAHLFERSGTFGAGIAYATRNENHLLNVRVANMSAFPDRPEHFYDWLRARDPEAGWRPEDFVPRLVYQRYLESLLEPYRGERLFLHADAIVDLAPDGAGVKVTARSGVVFRADAAVLATGNEPAITRAGGHVADYWSSRGDFGLPPDAAVAIFGTGLSMIDSVLSLKDDGHTGPIHAISRRGQVPATHRAVAPVRIDLSDLPLGRGLPALLHAVRRIVRAGGADWRGVVDGLRPHTRTIWRSLSRADRARFLRHLRPWWDVHRHRMAPAVAARVAEARETGQLTVHAGHLLSVRERDDGAVAVTFRERGTGAEKTLEVGAIVDCRGGNPRFSNTRNPALIALMDRGLARPDALDLGVDVTDDLRVRDHAGHPSDRIFAIGPLTRGAFWEVTAVPDIRNEAVRLAETVLEGPKGGESQD